MGWNWDWGFGGMHFFWWLFWVISIVVFFSFAMPVRRVRYAEFRSTPLDVLRKRYAAGELTTAEFDERRDRLLADDRGLVPPAMPRLNPTAPKATQHSAH